MVDFVQAARDAVRTSYCNLTRPGDAFAPLANDLLNTLPGNVGTDAAQRLFNRAWNARNAFCSEPPSDASPAIAPPFEGGQCPGTIYTFNARSLLNGVPNSPFFQRSGPGPLSVSEGLRNDGGPRIAINDGEGNELLQSGAPPGVGELSWEIVGMNPPPGAPGECGDPPSEAPEYIPDDFTQPIDITFEDNSNNTDVTISPNVTFSPIFVDAEANFKIPFNLNVSPNVDISGTLDLSTGDVSYNNVNNVNIEVPEQPVEIPTGTEPPSPLLKTIGARVVSTIDNSLCDATIIEQAPGTSDLYVPRLGTLSFVYMTAMGTLAQGEDLDVKFLNQVFFSQFEIVDVVWSPCPGVTSQIFLITISGNEGCSCS